MREIKKKRKGKRMEREEKGGDSERENIRERKRERVLPRVGLIEDYRWL